MNAANDDERALHRVATRSFLRFWSWPNLYRDQGHIAKNGEGQELCDLLVVFGRNLVVFSDKRVAFSQSAPVNVAWQRWRTKAVDASVKQARGASRWLLSHPDRIYTDRRCTTRIPLSLPTREAASVKNVIICRGVDSILHAQNGEPSFWFASPSTAALHMVPLLFGFVADPSDPFSHIFSEATINLVLTEFDTAPDFLSYLDEREKLLTQPRPLTIHSETDIIRMYYEGLDDSTGRRSILLSQTLQSGAESISTGGLAALVSTKQYRAKTEANSTSYFWDDLIERFSHHILEGTIEASSCGSVGEAEEGIRTLAASSRFERRVLADAFITFYRKALPRQRATRIVRNIGGDGVAYLFLLLPSSAVTSDSQYRQLRREMLEAYCLAAKHDLEELAIIIGIAAKTREDGRDLSSDFFLEGQDFVIIEFSSWTTADQKRASELNRKLRADRLMSKRREFRVYQEEFPVHVPGTLIRGSQRNAPCPCGSGRKAKKCCGSVR